MLRLGDEGLEEAPGAARDQAQRAGIGSRLVRHALGGLRDQGVLYAQAFIRDFPGHEPALLTFRSSGFERRARRLIEF